MSLLKNKLMDGAIWMIITRMSVKLLGIVSTMILARLLAPEDFGLVAMVTAVYAFIDIFGAAGFNAALIQRQSKARTEFDTVWTIGLFFGLIAFLVLSLLATSIAAFFDEPRLQSVTYCIAFLFCITGLKNVGVINFQMEMDFKTEFKFQLVPKILSFICTISFAYYLKNYWALVIGMLFNQCVIVITSYLMHPYRPRICLKKWGELFNFSKWLLINDIIRYVNTRSLDLMVGKAISTKAAGLYNVSLEIAMLPVSEIVGPINRAAFPAYSKAKEDINELKNLYYYTLSMIAVIIMPTCVGLLMLSNELVRVMLGEQWVQTIPIIEYLSLAAFFVGLSTNNGYVFIAIGKPHLGTYNALARSIILVICVIAMIKLNGLVGAAQGLFIASVIGIVISYVCLVYLIKLNFLSLVQSTARPFLSVIAMALCLYNIEALVATESLLSLMVIKIIVGAVSYTAVLLALWLITGRPDGIESSILSRFKR